MAVTVRPARPGDPAAGLLYEAAASYYDAYAGDAATARRVLDRVYPHGGHSASFEVSRVAEVEGEVAGVLAAFPAAEAERYARRFVMLSLRLLPPGRWRGAVANLRAAARVAPSPPHGSWYVDALAVGPRWRRRGVAGALLEAAEHDAAAAGMSLLALDTGLENAGAQALYAGHGFHPLGESRASDAATARALGGEGFVSYAKTL